MSKYAKRFMKETDASSSSSSSGEHVIEMTSKIGATSSEEPSGSARRSRFTHSSKELRDAETSTSTLGSSSTTAEFDGVSHAVSSSGSVEVVGEATVVPDSKQRHTEVALEDVIVENSRSDEGDDDGMDDHDDDDVDDDMEDADDDAVSSSPTRQLYSCDVCPHALFTTVAALHTHALEQHSDLLPDFARLRTVATKLVPLWTEAKARKREAIKNWGKKMFRVAARRDAGAEKMTEAHRAREQLELIVQRWHPSARVYVFGSSVTFAVWDGMADIDFTVVDVEEVEAGTWPPPERNAVRSITELLRRAGFSFVNLEPISHARVPIIKHHASSPIRVSVNEPITSSFFMSPQSAQPVAKDATSALFDTDTGRAGAAHDEAEMRTQLEAEAVIARSVRYVLSAPASWEDRLVLEGSVRAAVGAEAVQQVWWNRTAEMMSVTLDSTTSAVRAATCGLSLINSSLRVRVQPLHDECRPEIYNIDFDLSFRAFGIRNSLLLRRYLLSHPCARPGAIVLKDWSKSSGVNNSMNGFLTSYAVNILWIYFLVQKGVIPYVDPVEDIPAALRGNDHYGPDYVAFVDPTWSPERLEALHEEAGNLLLDFFYFYAFEFNWAEHVVSLNRKGITTKRMLGWDAEDVSPTAVGGSDSSGGGGAAHRPRNPTRYSFCVEDPYEENLNLGRHMGVTKTLRVQSEFLRGVLSLLKDKEKESCVFAATDVAEAGTQGLGTSIGAAATTSAAAGEGQEGLAQSQIEHQQPLLSGKGARGASATGPSRLPLKVLYRLMAVAMQEMSAACRAQGHLSKDSGGTTSMKGDSGSTLTTGETTTTTSVSLAGVSEADLEAAFRAKAPLEYQLARKAWNWQQLVHRLGYKISRGTVYARREVGMRRTVPRGVLPSSAAEAEVAGSAAGMAAAGALDAAAAAASRGALASEDIGSSGSTSAGTVGRGGFAPAGRSSVERTLELRSLGFTEQLILALSSGYTRLTPDWVAWSKPWTSLHLRGSAFFSSRAPSSMAQQQSVPSAGSSSSGSDSGALRGTRPQLAPRRPVYARGTSALAALLRAALHK